MHRYPTAPLLAVASPAELEAVPYLPHPRIEALLEQARTSIASLAEATVAELVRDQIRQLRDWPWRGFCTGATVGPSLKHAG